MTGDVKGVRDTFVEKGGAKILVDAANRYANDPRTLEKLLQVGYMMFQSDGGQKALHDAGYCEAEFARLKKYKTDPQSVAYAINSLAFIASRERQDLDKHNFTGLLKKVVAAYADDYDIQ